MPTQNEDSYLKRRLLSPPPTPLSTLTEKVTIVNEKVNNMTSSDKEADLRLHTAVGDDDIEEVKSLIGENPNLVFEKSDEGQTPLHILTISGDESAPDIAKLLLGVTVSLDGKFRTERESALHDIDDQGYTPMHYSARNWFPELTELLLKCGANPNAQDLKGDTPFHLCAEGNLEEALECAKLILSYDPTGQLINKKNGEEFTGLHRAVKKQAVNMVKLLLEHTSLNLTQQTSTSGQNILQYLCIESGETEKSCEIFKAIAQKCSAEQLNSEDEDGRTVLHTSAIERLPKITEILVEDERMDVLKVDKRKRLALHYSSENGSYPDGYRCVEHLIKKKFKRTKVQIQHLYEMMDDMGSSAFMYACLNCPVETMNKYLNAIREPQFWMNETNMTLLYKQCPLAIKALLDGAFTERKKSRSDLDEIVADFGPITGYIDPVEVLPQQETYYLKNALWWDYPTQKEILMHPLVQLFVVKKCKKLRAIINGWILWQIMYLAAYTVLAVVTYCKVLESTITPIIAAIIVFIYIVISFINEIFELCSVGLRYILSLTNLFQLAQIVLAGVAISPVLFGMKEPTIIQKNCAATGILLAYVLSMKDIGKMHEEIGLVVEVLKQVVIQIVKVLLCCSPLLAGFTLAFVILFNDDESLNTSFPGPLVKVLVMMTGEFEYNDTFKEVDEDGNVNPESKKNRAIRLLLFLSFLICVPVAFFNLLTGFALERVIELRERAKVGRIAKQLEHIHFIESILLSLRPLQKLLPHGKLARHFRKFNVTTAMIDGDLKFETFIGDETRKKIDRRTAKEKQLDICNCLRSMFGTELSSEARYQIFALASQQKP